MRDSMVSENRLQINKIGTNQFCERAYLHSVEAGVTVVGTFAYLGKAFNCVGADIPFKKCCFFKNSVEQSKIN